MNRKGAHCAPLIIDIVIRFHFEGPDTLLARACEAADVILKLGDEADRLGLPAIYVNDNHGEGTSDRAV
jgi:hypothetical protein